MKKALMLLFTRFSSARFMTLVGTTALGIIFVCVNILSSRFYQRWDVTSAQLYTLSSVTEETLKRLEQPVEVVVFLSRSDPLTRSVYTLLDAYKALTPLLRPRFVDPDRNPAEFIALQQQYGIFEGKTENGRLATEASVVLAQGEKRWFITTDDILVFDEEDGSAKPRLEQALTEGLVNLLGRDKVSVCFTSGHRELSMESGGAQSLAEFQRELEQNNYNLRAVDLVGSDPEATLAGCRLMVIAGPNVPFSQEAATRLAKHLATGANLFALVGPLSDDDGRILDPGLTPLLAQFGIALQKNVVFEGDDKLRLPIGIGGEVFLATPAPHATTQAFLRGDAVQGRVLIQLGQGLELDPKADATRLLYSSASSVSVNNFRTLSGGELWNGLTAKPQEYIVAAAAQSSAAPEEDATGKPLSKTRVLVVGSASVLWSSTFTDPALLGTRRFVENAVSWLTEQPQLVSVPEKPSHPAGLSLSEAALEEVQRYVLLYMPLCVALLGGLLVYRRRRDLAD